MPSRRKPNKEDFILERKRLDGTFSPQKNVREYVTQTPDGHIAPPLSVRNNPQPPTNLSIVEQKIFELPDGSSRVDVVISWDAQEEMVFEVDIGEPDEG